MYGFRYDELVPVAVAYDEKDMWDLLRPFGTGRNGDESLVCFVWIDTRQTTLRRSSATTFSPEEIQRGLNT
jgi:hypothetical protein